MYLKKSAVYAVSLSLVGFISACGVSGNDGTDSVSRGLNNLVKATVIDDINASTMLQVIHTKIDSNATNAFGYKAVKISYKTVGQDDKPLVASGLLVIPTATAQYQQYRLSQGKKPFSVSMLCNNHGTIFKDTEAPSNVELLNGSYPQAVLMTGYAGFAAIYPDYIGFGDSNTTVHPYILKKAAAREAVDMLKASMTYMKNNNVVLNYQLYISGYSEGGYNALAMAEEVEKNFSDKVNLMGVAPMAGPYNVEALADVDLNATQPMAYPAFLADLAYSYTHYYNDVNLSDIAIPSLVQFQLAFSGQYDTVPIHIILGMGAVDAQGNITDYGFYTHATNELFKDSFISDYQNNQNNIMRQKFAENTLDNSTPRSKMNFIQCVDDDIIPFSESNDIYNKFKANGADVTLTPIPTGMLSQQKDATHPFVHVNCVPAAYATAVKWFAAIRNGDIK